MVWKLVAVLDVERRGQECPRHTSTRRRGCLYMGCGAGGEGNGREWPLHIDHTTRQSRLLFS
jgi:hypothetical protein